MQAKVVSLKQLSEHYWRMRLAKPVGFNFKAGQYISLLVHPDGHRRTYSISSPPSTSYLDLLADVTPMGFGSRYILSLNSGDTINFIGPLGKFVKTSDGLFLAGGSGIAPYLSMQSSPILWSLRRKSDAFPVKHTRIFYTRLELTTYLKSHISYLNFYLCGSPSYVSGLTKIIISLGVDPTHLHTEKFV